MDQTLKDVWARFEKFDAYSVAEQTKQRLLRLSALALTITGSVLATAADQFKALHDSTYVAVASGLLLAVAAFIASKYLASKDASNWVTARAVAEALKSECFRYAATVDPYGDPAKRAGLLLDAQANAEKTGATLPVESATVREAGKWMPKEQLDAVKYVTQRAEDQRAWYERRSAEHGTTRKYFEWVASLLAIAAVLLGGLHAVIKDVQMVAAWVAVIGGVTASIAAFVAAQRYKAMEDGYRVAATQLRQRISRWRADGEPNDDPARNALVFTCEGIMRAENGAWMADWMDTAAHPATDIVKPPKKEP